MVQMSLYNLQGALMGTQRQEVGAAETMVLDLPGLYPGAYVLQLSAPGFTRTVRVMCQPE
ncbi:MAG: T9SS type A sorting domain-containing protein [Lewinellaceae bacterium]|nr:T9SS type A sorting domain-containing protein [Lewinellaceae bacterium]